MTTTTPQWSRPVQLVPVLIAVGLLVCAALIALAPIVNGDNYCGRLYFDTQSGNACAGTMAARGHWVLALGGIAVMIIAGLVVAARSLRLLAVVVLTGVALAGVLVGFNRLLQPTPNRVGYCGSVLNPIVLPDVPGHDPRCRALLDPFKRSATIAFGVSLLAGIAGIGAGVGPLLRSRESEG